MKSHTKRWTSVWSRYLFSVEIYKKTDSEYVRKGTCSIFIFAEPLSGWSYASVQKRRTAEDLALEIKLLLTECIRSIKNYPGNGQLKCTCAGIAV